jgi:hypothetical protein
MTTPCLSCVGLGTATSDPLSTRSGTVGDDGAVTAVPHMCCDPRHFGRHGTCSFQQCVSNSGPLGDEMSNSYAIVSALIFALVAVGHVVRLVQGWSVAIGPYNVSMNVSWAALSFLPDSQFGGFMQLG